MVLGAVLIGGTSFTGGEGGVAGTALGVIFLGVIQNGLQLSSVSTFWQGTISGGILIAAVGVGVLREHGWKRLKLRRLRTTVGQPETSGDRALDKPGLGTTAPAQASDQKTISKTPIAGPAEVRAAGDIDEELARLRKENAELRRLNAKLKDRTRQ
jgi:hypothetical protein